MTLPNLARLRTSALVLLLATALGAGCLKRSRVARTYVLDPLPAATAGTPPSPSQTGLWIQ